MFGNDFDFSMYMGNLLACKISLAVLILNSQRLIVGGPIPGCGVPRYPGNRDWRF